MEEKRDLLTLTVGALAKRFGLNTKTLRYYEEVDILPASRGANGYRLYSEADAERLSFVLRAKRAGFTLDEIKEVLRLGRHGKACGYVRGTLGRHIEAVDAQIADLMRTRAELEEFRTEWQGDKTASGKLCGLIEGWSPASSTTKTNQENNMTSENNSRLVEVFTAGCPSCDPVVKLVQDTACGSCNVTVHNTKDDPKAHERAKAAGVSRFPFVLVDGKPASCCENGGGAITQETLRAAGIGAAR